MTAANTENLPAPPGRADLRLIASFVREGEKIMDIGCGDGELLRYLQQMKQVDGRGMDIRTDAVQACLKSGIRAVQGDAESDLQYYGDGFFDAVIAGDMLQTTHFTEQVLRDMIRIGKRLIISSPNFGYWRNRLHLLCKGRMPVTSQLSYQWYETPNIHFSTAKDFILLARQCGCRVTQAGYIAGNRELPGYLRFSANLLAQKGVYVLEKA